MYADGDYDLAGTIVGAVDPPRASSMGAESPRAIC